MLPRTALAGTGLLVSLVALALTLWIVVPAPTDELWTISLGAIELSLWLALLATLGLLLGAGALGLGSRLLASAALLCGLPAVVLAALPTLQARRTAAQQGVALSTRRYFFGSSSAAANEETRDVQYAEIDGQALRLDIYRLAPSQGGELRPGLITIHGGGWSDGVKGGTFTPHHRALAQEGLIVFDIDYRLAGPKLRFPAPVADVKCAIGWVKRNADRYGVDPRRIALLGRSAGGQLALTAAYSTTGPEIPSSCPAGDTSVRAVVSFYAPIDLAWGYAHPTRPDFYDGPWHLRNYLGGTPETMPDTYRLASPNYHVTAASPPTLIIHGGHDQIVGADHAPFLADALAAAGVPHRLVLLPWANHGFDYFRHGWSSQIVDAIRRDFLRKHLESED